MMARLSQLPACSRPAIQPDGDAFPSWHVVRAVLPAYGSGLALFLTQLCAILMGVGTNALSNRMVEINSCFFLAAMYLSHLFAGVWLARQAGGKRDVVRTLLIALSPWLLASAVYVGANWHFSLYVDKITPAAGGEVVLRALGSAAVIVGSALLGLLAYGIVAVGAGRRLPTES